MGKKGGKMVILGFDTATAMLCVGIKNNKRIAESNIVADRKHQELLFVEIKKLLDETQTNINDLQAVACGLGPGSFIGSRIAVAAAKTIAQVRDIPLIGIPTPDIIAAGIDTGDVLVATDAMRGEIFYSYYKNNERQGEIQVVKPDEFKKLFKDKSLAVTGNALGKYPEIFTDLASYAVLTRYSEEKWYPQGENIVKLAAKIYNKNKFDNPYKLTPIYVREVDARESFIIGSEKHSRC
jgi:tRNA threonylcarbamoyl adenosine modification protein YeaZ